MCCSLVAHTVPLASAMYCVVIRFESVTSATEAAAGTKQTAADKGHVTLTLKSIVSVAGCDFQSFQCFVHIMILAFFNSSVSTKRSGSIQN